MLSARSPRYPALYDELSGVRFLMGRAEVTEEQAHLLAERPYVDAILIGEFDEDGRPANELPAKDWRKAQRRDQPPVEQASTDVTSDNTDVVEPPSVPEPREPKKPRSK